MSDTATQQRTTTARLHAANDRRRAASAHLIGPRLTRALDILDGVDVPDVLCDAAHLRLEHLDETLAEVAARCATTKDTLAGRLRRFLQYADRHARRRCIPDTSQPAASSVAA